MTTSARSRTPGSLLLVLASIVSVQFGAAMAAQLIPVIGVLGSVTLRLLLGTLVLLVVARPSVRGHSRGDFATAIAFGVSLAAMNTSYYASIARLPIGVAVTIEFTGPLLLSASMSRRGRDVAAVVTAGFGVILISQVFHADVAHLDPLGVGLAALAGACWAAYIVLSARTGARFADVDGLTWAMLTASVLVTPFGIASAGTALLPGHVLLTGFGISMLSSVLPYSFELLALRSLDARTFGILLSLEPAFAALAGFLVLGQRLDPLQLLGMGLVVAASIAVAASPGLPKEPADLGG